MRRVSTTHRVALDWLFDRITLDPKIQIKYIEPKEISRVMSGIICACSMLAISVLQFALTHWRNEFNTIQVEKESQQNQNL